MMAPRLCFDVLFPIGSVQDLDLVLFARLLRRRLLHGQEVLVAPRTLFAAPESVLVDLSGLAGLLVVWPLCESAVYVTRTLAVVAPGGEPEAWRPVLDAALADDPCNAVLHVRWRPSRGSGGIWVAPPPCPDRFRR